MGLLTGLFGLPLAPVRGVTWVAEQIRRQAVAEFYDPRVIRRKLQDVQDAREAGEITDQEAADLEDELVDRLVSARAYADEGTEHGNPGN